MKLPPSILSLICLSLPILSHAEVALPDFKFALDPEFECRVSGADPTIVAHLRDTYGVETVSTSAALAIPGNQVKFLPDADNPLDGLMQVPQAVWDEATSLLPTFAAEYDTKNPRARGTTLLRRVLEATNTPFSFSEKTLRLYLCPNIGLAYAMTHWPFYLYLKSIRPAADKDKVMSKRDWTDWYMLHEILHWYTFDQPYLRRWTPVLDRVYKHFAATDPEFLAGDVLVPATTATDCRDAYPSIYFNMNNLISHLHINGLRKTILEPAAWEYVRNREKEITGDKYYGQSIDIVDAMSKAEMKELLAEITQTRVPPGCIAK